MSMDNSLFYIKFNTMKELKELQLLKDYIEMYIQLLPYCVGFGGIRLHKPQLPTFEEFKIVQPYSGLYKESYDIHNGKVYKQGTEGLGTSNGIAYRYFNYWKGCKYYPIGNFEGKYMVNTKYLTEINKLKLK